MDENLKNDEKQARNWVVFCHLGGLVTVSFFNLLIPIVIWLMKKDESPFIDEQGKEIVNFQISIAIYGLVLFLIAFTIIGMPVTFLGMFVLVATNIVSIIKGAIKASNGEEFLYPINLRLIK